ncbi:MAG: aminopeptidase P N-terminal domain-containing protein [Steroidobacteraceae bacterium]
MVARPRPVAAAEYARRRAQLMRSMGPGSIAVVPSAPLQMRNSDVEHRYRQDSDFHYLTGFGEPEAVAVLVPKRRAAEYILFVRDRDPQRETWDGLRAGPAGAVRDFGADDAFPIGDIDEILPGLLENRDKVFYAMGVNWQFEQRLLGWINGLRAHGRYDRHAPAEVVALQHLLHDMRLTKSRAEIAQMREAAAIGCRAHQRAMRAARAGRYEYQIAAELLHEFHLAGAELSYQPIVAGGRNACILHYHENRAPLVSGELLLVDAGCEYRYYASDITRTYPVNGRFSPVQRAVYEVVLAANQAAIDKVRPGNHWNEPHDAAVRVLTEGLVKLGVLKGKPGQLVKSDAYRKFYMHRTGHWLGMDVHDVGDYKLGDAWRVLEPGMALTIEPGLYFPKGMRGLPRGLAGTGIRIEDDVIVGTSGPEVLTETAPKSVKAIEKLMSMRR